MAATDGIAALILEALDQGFDVEIRMRRRDDGKEGVLKMPTPWARRIGMTEAQIEEMISK